MFPEMPVNKVSAPRGAMILLPLKIAADASKPATVLSRANPEARSHSGASWAFPDKPCGSVSKRGEIHAIHSSRGSLPGRPARSLDRSTPSTQAGVRCQVVPLDPSIILDRMLGLLTALTNQFASASERSVRQINSADRAQGKSAHQDRLRTGCANPLDRRR